MIVTPNRDADPDAVRRALVERGLRVRMLSDSRDGGRVLLLVEAGSTAVPAGEIESVEGVASVATAASPWPRLERMAPDVELDGVRIGRECDPVVIAGPCSVESEDQIHRIAAQLSRRGVRLLRGGAFKPRTSPYSFQGHGTRALRWMREAADAHGMLVVTEALGVEHVQEVAAAADLLQIGSRNMHHAPLLRAAGATGMAVLLKRGMAATVDEWLLAGEQCLLAGAASVVFCERGIRGFDPSTRNVLDLGAVALVSQVHGHPVIADPSHAAGRRDLLAPLSRAALAAGASGVMLEVHDDPARALSDGPQALPLESLDELLPGLSGAPVPAPVAGSG